MLRLAPLQPAQSSFAGSFGVFVGGGGLYTLVKGHGDIAAQVGLNLHRFLWSHKNFPSVDVGGKGDPFLFDFPQARQREHLKSAGIGEDGAVPVHEGMQATQFPHHLVPRPQVQMVCVGQLHLTADFLQVQGRDSPLDGPLGAHVHKYRGLYCAVGAGKFPPPGFSFCFNYLEHAKTPFFKLS